MSRIQLSSISPRSRHWLGRGLLVAVIVMAVCTGLLGWRAMALTSAQHDTDSAVAAARTATGAVLTYNARTLDADLAAARRYTTAPFTQKFDQTAQGVIEPTARQQGTATKAAVVRAALIDSRPDRVETLLFVDQSTTTTAQAQPEESTAQVRVVMTKVAGSWLISDLIPL